MKITIVYFSATDTTKTIVTELSREMSNDLYIINITNMPIEEKHHIPSNEILIIGMPVYAGRIPSVAIESIKNLYGENTPTILVAVYGNREFDDIFVEMQDILEHNNFKIIAGGAFIAQHSIFPITGKGRPDEKDKKKIKEFAQLCKNKIEGSQFEKIGRIELPGNHPYKKPGKIPLKINVNTKCTDCGACIRVCPAKAIPEENPHITNFEKCIHCGRCIKVCKMKARNYRNPLYKIAETIFYLKNRKRKEPEFYI